MCHRATENTEKTLLKGLCVLCGSVAKLSCNSAQVLKWVEREADRMSKAFKMNGIFGMKGFFLDKQSLSIVFYTYIYDCLSWLLMDT